jgi:DNA-binding response OmpR family regulator
MKRSTPKPLAGERVLIVEDRYLIASELAHEVDRLGGSVLGPAKDLASAADIVAREDVQIALLDVNVDGEMIFPLAEALADRGVPFIFITGYDREGLPAAWQERPQLRKPVDHRRLSEQLAVLASSRT